MIEVHDRPLVTLGLLAYNQEKFVEEAVRAALAQTYSPLEIILSDDCSLDATFEVISAAASAYCGPHQVRVNRNNRNLGIVGHYNHVGALARGRWLFSAAGDDISLPDRVSVCMETVLSRTTAVAAFSDFEEFGELAGQLATHALPEPADFLLERQIENFGVRIPGATLAVDRRLLDLFGPMPTEAISEDRILPFRARLLGDIVYVPRVLVRRRRHKGSVNAKNLALRRGNRQSRRSSARRAAQERIARLKAFTGDLSCAKALGLVSETQQRELTRLIEERMVGLRLLADCHSNRYRERFMAGVLMLAGKEQRARFSRRQRLLLGFSALLPSIDSLAFWRWWAERRCAKSFPK